MKYKFKSAWYIMRMWQTGNIGARNIHKLEEQPEDGFASNDKALAWMIDNVVHQGWDYYTIMEIWEPIN